MRVLRNYFDVLSNITLHDTNNKRSAVLSCKNHIIYIEIHIVSWVNVCHSLNRRSTTAEFSDLYMRINARAGTRTAISLQKLQCAVRIQNKRTRTDGNISILTWAEYAIFMELQFT